MGEIRECLEVSDFAGVLRLMADNADHLALRHDVAEMAGLRRRVAEQAVQAQRDADLIAELRKQLEAAWQQLEHAREASAGAAYPLVASPYPQDAP